MQKGFLLLETALVSVLVVAAALVCASFAMMNREREASETEYAAVFIAQEQIARIEGNAAHYAGHSGEIAWLGDASAIRSLNGRDYHVRTEMQSSDAGVSVREVVVRVVWETDGRKQERIYRKLVDCGG